MKKVIGFMITCCLWAVIFAWGEHTEVEPEVEDSFVCVDDAYSFDNELCAKQSVEDNEGVRYVRVEVWDRNGNMVDSFFTERAWDFWGICWENDTYNLWIQSGDVGIYCMEYVDGKWQANRDKERPDYIKSKYDKDIK